MENPLSPVRVACLNPSKLEKCLQFAATPCLYFPPKINTKCVSSTLKKKKMRSFCVASDDPSQYDEQNRARYADQVSLYIRTMSGLDFAINGLFTQRHCRNYRLKNNFYAFILRGWIRPRNFPRYKRIRCSGLYLLKARFLCTLEIIAISHDTARRGAKGSTNSVFCVPTVYSKLVPAHYIG